MQFWFLVYISIEFQKHIRQLFVVVFFYQTKHHIWKFYRTSISYKNEQKFQKRVLASFKFTIGCASFSLINRFQYFRVFFVGNKADEYAWKIYVMMIMDELGK